MSCFYATPLLSYGEEFPRWAVVQPDTVGGCVEAIRDAKSVHVADRVKAEAVMLALGMTEDAVELQLHFVETGRLLPIRPGSSTR